MPANYTCDHKGCSKKADYHVYWEDGSAFKSGTDTYCAEHDPEKRPLQQKADAAGRQIVGDISNQFFGLHPRIQEKVLLKLEYGFRSAIRDRAEVAQRKAVAAAKAARS